MIKVGFKRPPGWKTLGQKEVRAMRAAALRQVLNGLNGMQEAILQTPVYTGKTLANYHWSLSAAVESVRAPVKNPDRPGKTSEMPLGSEPRRRAQEEVLNAEFASLKASLCASPTLNFRIYLTNTTPYFDEIEYGSYAYDDESDDNISRTPPGGMVRRGETAIAYSLQGLRRVQRN